MPQLLIEVFSEEIPARMQKRAEEDLARALGEKLKAHGLEPNAIRTFSTPRRIGAVINDLPSKAADVNDEKKGPRVGSPEQAVQGFLKSAGLSSLDQAQIVEDKKGAFYVARIERAGRETEAVLQEIVPEIVRGFPWPKSMRSGESDLTWVRPLQNIMCIYAGAQVKISVDGVPSEAKTWGHRFHAPAAIAPKDFADYAAKLRGAKVEIDREARKALILENARKLCAAKKLELVEDIGLLEEVAGLVEWPVVLLGDMSADFLDLPQEVIRLSMRTHQKYFAVRDPKTQSLAPHFVLVANVEAKDGGKAIAAGNARVLSARLNDARFFWDADCKTELFTEARRAKLEKIVFHQKLGSVWDKVERVKALAVELASVVYGPPAPSPAGAAHAGEAPAVHIAQRNFATLEHFIAAVERAADLCKMDLVTETVGEFPELQGQIGRLLYSLEKDANASIAAAIEDHYRPLGPNDRVPSDPVAITLALADKLDTLVGFWAIDEKPTGSSDPYALRRAALGLARLQLDSDIRLNLRTIVRSHLDWIVFWGGAFSLTKVHSRTSTSGSSSWVQTKAAVDRTHSKMRRDAPNFPPADYEAVKNALGSLHQRLAEGYEAHLFDLEGKLELKLVEDGLVAFLADRLKVQLRDQGKRHDLVDAVFALGDDDLVRIVARVEALDAFLKTEDGANLLAGYKRAANILAAEEKKGKGLSEADLEAGLDAKLLAEPAEKALHAALEAAIPKARASVEAEDFAAAMGTLSSLRAPVDEFFEKVLVNAEDASIRRNRLLLLSRLREALSAVADFSKIEG
jgi:glycyl-tRNA synthetase beta chain